MTAAQAIEGARAVGVIVEVWSGTMVVRGPRHVVDVWRPHLARLRDGIVELLAPPPPRVQLTLGLQCGGRQ